MLNVTKLYLLETCIKVMKNNGNLPMKARMTEGKRDCYIPGETNIYVIYGRDEVKNWKSPNVILDLINFTPSELYKSGIVKTTETSVIIGGMEFLKKSLPLVDSSRCLEIKAEKNKVVFVPGNYYGFYDSDGVFHTLVCKTCSLGQPLSDLLAKRQNETSNRVGFFWDLLSWDGTYINLYFSEKEERKMLNDAGITEGFFSIEVGSQKQDYFYSNGVAGTAVMKRRYDEQYKYMFTDAGSWWWLSEYEAGSIFKVGGKEYVLDENKRLHVPYGVDIFDIKYPPKQKDNG